MNSWCRWRGPIEDAEGREQCRRGDRGSPDMLVRSIAIPPANAFSRRQSAGFIVMVIQVRMRQTRMNPVTWEFPPGFKCQTQSTSLSAVGIAHADPGVTDLLIVHHRIVDQDVEAKSRHRQSADRREQGV